MVSEKQSNSIKPKGGKRPGAGRKAGVPNKRTAELQDAVASTGMTPLDYMLKVMRDDGEDDFARRQCAIAAAPYVHAKLSSITADVNHTGDVFAALLQAVNGTALKVVPEDE